MVELSKCKYVTIEFCSDYYKTQSCVEGYVVSIHLTGHPSEWDIPHDVQQIVILPPTWRGQMRRPRRKRISLIREGNRRHRCSQCKNYGNNRQNCRTLFEFHQQTRKHHLLS